MKYPNLERLVEIIEILRSENGCAWDREQTHDSLKRNMLEEAYEAIDAINSKDKNNLCEELGDVLLQVVLHAQIARENNDFNIEDVAKGISDKLIRRHPHVFGDIKEDNPEKIIENWEKIKKEEKKERKSIMDGISTSQASLMSALKISKKAVSVGFEWCNLNTLYECLYSEVEEFKQAKNNDDIENMEEELGDILFATVNLGRYNGLDAEQALIKANHKFIKRFRKMEEIAQKPLEEHTVDEYDRLWKEAKRLTKTE